MKKIIVTAMIFIGCIGAHADISVNMQNSDWIYFPTSGNNLPLGALVQLIWDSNADSSFSYATPVAGIVPTGSQYDDGDYVLFSGLTTSSGGWSGDFDGGSTTYDISKVGGANINNGYVYMFVFQDGIPNAGDFYARSASIGPSLTMFPGSGQPPTADYLDITPSGAITLNALTVAAVPEPSTVGLLLVGAGLLAFRRMRRS